MLWCAASGSGAMFLALGCCIGSRGTTILFSGAQGEMYSNSTALLTRSCKILSEPAACGVVACSLIAEKKSEIPGTGWCAGRSNPTHLPSSAMEGRARSCKGWREREREVGSAVTVDLESAAAEWKEDAAHTAAPQQAAAAARRIVSLQWRSQKWIKGGSGEATCWRWGQPTPTNPRRSTCT